MKPITSSKVNALHQPKKITGAKLIKKEPRWFEKEITLDCFIKKTDKKGKHYAQHKEWKNNAWIGAYDTDEELDKVLKDYIKNSKRPAMERKEVKNLHSVIMTDKDW